MRLTHTELIKLGRTRRDKFLLQIPTEGDFSNAVELHLMPKDVYDHKDYPTCIQCQNKYVPIHKGEMICFSCSFTRK